MGEQDRQRPPGVQRAGDLRQLIAQEERRRAEESAPPTRDRRWLAWAVLTLFAAFLIAILILWRLA